MSLYPEHKKFDTFTIEQQSAIHEFCDFIDSKYTLVEIETDEQTFAYKIYKIMLNIDEKKLEKERQLILEKHRGIIQSEKKS